MHTSSIKILLGVSGGIAVYKSAELVRLLKNSGSQVRVVMTEAATEFVTPLTFQALSGHRVHRDLLDCENEAAMGHIHLARWADFILVAPASANFIARLRLGLADDLLAALCLAAEAPLILAPAMNQAMWQNPATQENLAVLRQRGVSILGPAIGAQACGESGPGRMLEPSLLCEHVSTLSRKSVLKGLSVLVTAGPTREAIDPVRFLSNRSSGKMGYALAQAATEAGADVCLVSGPVCLADVPSKQLIRVESAEEMHACVMERAPAYDIFIAAAAVADYRPAHPAPGKIKKKQPVMRLELTRNPDILAEVAALPEKPFCVGFAAETSQLETYALEKLKGKNLDMIAANRVGDSEGGFDRDENALQVFWPGGRHELELVGKPVLARQLIDLIAERYYAKNPTKNS